MQQRYKIELLVDANEWNEEKIKRSLEVLNFQVTKVTKTQNRRTNKQNKALHLYFTHLAEALNDAGYDMRKTIKDSIDIPWTPETIKENLWRPVQKAYLQKDSTTKLDTIEIDKVYDVLNKAIGERTGVHVPFPSIETLTNN